jgi:hypothetical protein
VRVGVGVGVRVRVRVRGRVRGAGEGEGEGEGEVRKHLARRAPPVARAVAPTERGEADAACLGLGPG